MAGHLPSRVYQVFGKVGWQNDQDRHRPELYLRGHQSGNGQAAGERVGFPTRDELAPDFTQNLLNFVNLTGTQFLTDHWLLSANAYYRHLLTDSANGNVSDNYLSDDYGGPPIDCAAPLTRTDLAYCDAESPRRTWFSALPVSASQLTDSPDVFGWKNQAVFGADYSDARNVHATFPNTVICAGRHAHLYGQSAQQRNGHILERQRRLPASISPTPFRRHELHFTASLRYNRNTETLNGYSLDTDVSDAGAGFDAASPLLGDHTFSRLNPAFGFTLTPTATLTLYGDYNEASRAPTVIRLGCSNPAAPCGLPNDFASDPDLKQVVARTVEIGARSDSEDKNLNWSVDVFHTVNSDDIQFVAASTNQGYFDNVGNTRRQGADLSVGGKVDALSWRLVYSFVDATFQSNFEVNGDSNSSADANGNIQVRPGDRIPLIPRHTGRAVLDYAPNEHWDLGANLMFASGIFLHGNENNANQAGGTNAAGSSVLGSGWINGYAVLNLHGTYHIGKSADAFIRVVNVFDKNYATAGFLTSNAFNPNGTFRPNPDDWTNENAVSPAQPRAAWVGVRFHW